MELKDLILLFFIYSVIGWIVEVILVYFESKKFVNRGFLIGPYLPIYGTGAVLMTVINHLVLRENNSFAEVFLMAFLVCGLLEYLTSYILERRFKIRWWDYSKKPMNLYGRVWIGNLILFGLGGLIIIKFTNPIVYGVIDNIPFNYKNAIILMILVVIITDYIFSHFILKLLKTQVENSTADSTEKISEEIRFLFSSKSVFNRRLLEAYPNLEYRTDRIIARIERIRKETEKIIGAINDRFEDTGDRIRKGKELFVSYIEPVRSVQKDIINIQEKIISEMISEEDKKKNKEFFDKLYEKQKHLKNKESKNIKIIRKNLRR